MTENSVQKTGDQLRVMVPVADAEMIRKVHRILKSGTGDDFGVILLSHFFNPPEIH